MIARLSNGPAVPEGQPHLDIDQPTFLHPEPWIRMAPVGGAAGWARLELGMPAWEGEALYEVVRDQPVPQPCPEHHPIVRAGCPQCGAESVFLYVHATDFPVVPDRVWQGKGGAARQKLRIVGLERDGAIVFERIAGSPAGALRKPGRVARDQLAAAFVPTDEWDHGEATVHDLHSPPTNPGL